MSSISVSKNHSKRSNCNRERDKNKSLATTESGGSSQCDTPPLNDKEIKSENTSQGRYAGIGSESVQCMADQVGAELTADAAVNLAEDVSYKLRQVISTIATHSEMMMKSRVDSWDVNTVLRLMDTSPVVGAAPTFYTTFGDEKLICPVETFVNVAECATTTQSFVFKTLPSLTVEWITEEKSLGNNSSISVHLHNYYTKVARAILNLKKKPKELAVEDLMTNTRIGPIFPNLFNLAVLVLNDDNLNALNVPAKKPLQANVLDMVDALCSNPCSLDTNIQQQFQRLFPVMVSNILGNGSLAEKMVTILTKITRTWPSFIAIGKGILFEYLSQGTKERLTPPMIKCVTALGRGALVACLADHLDHLDQGIHAPQNTKNVALREAILDASTCLLRSEPTTYLEDYVTTDYTLYEMLGDSVLPRRLLRFQKDDNTKKGAGKSENSQDEDLNYMTVRPIVRRSKIRVIATARRKNVSVFPQGVFEVTKFKADNRSRLKIKLAGCSVLPVKSHRISYNPIYRPMNQVRPKRTLIAASGLLNRFKYRLKEPGSFPIFGMLML
ncbi:hypothetical protein EVAR_95814_1 [Eumeta japonica]|uniref:Transcription initiation factor TFIID subunit 6 n=1 Tax=Eumeta variegata TaxID=151549 RepID=A0A4C1W3N7_EUMVA|nr:hypothetical protein EVAR_95814_1 [Eumeta japonica]